MASPQKENGYTPIAHEILEAVAATRLNSTQLRTLMLIWRYSYGFHRKTATLSGSFIATALGVTRRQVEKAISDLQKRRLIAITKHQGKSREFQFNKDYEQWVGCELKFTCEQKDMGTKVHRTCEPEFTGRVNFQTHKKDTLKDKPKDNDAVDSFLEFWQELRSQQGLSKRKNTDKRRAHVRARLNEGFTLDELKQAMYNAATSPHMLGHNDRQMEYLDPVTVLRSADKLEKWRDKGAGNGQGRPGDIDYEAAQRRGEGLLGGDDVD